MDVQADVLLALVAHLKQVVEPGKRVGVHALAAAGVLADVDFEVAVGVNIDVVVAENSVTPVETEIGVGVLGNLYRDRSV